MPIPALPSRPAPIPARGASKPWLARLTRDVALWLRAPASNRPDWRAR